ncbi:MAG: hypothetical protein QF745_11610, partial [Planctomycetota bacterium]|nr:hypothetical protein [Planctomycetota bacterium]
IPVSPTIFLFIFQCRIHHAANPRPFASQAVTLVSQQEAICDGYNQETWDEMAGAGTSQRPEFCQSIF